MTDSTEKCAEEAALSFKKSEPPAPKPPAKTPPERQPSPDDYVR